MEFGLQFFPDVGPEDESAQQYWNECLDLVNPCDELGYTQVRTVEHYFEAYGGYSPAPQFFLTAASQLTSKARLLTGAILPVFNHPLKMAGEIGTLDAVSNGRLDCGFGRACLPHQFQRFDRDAYFKSLVAAAERGSSWSAGASSQDSPGYDRHLDHLQAANFDSLLGGGTIWVGTPEDIRQQVSYYVEAVGRFDIASLQVNIHLVCASDAAASQRIFSQEATPYFQSHIDYWLLRNQ